MKYEPIGEGVTAKMEHLKSLRRTKVEPRSGAIRRLSKVGATYTYSIRIGMRLV